MIPADEDNKTTWDCVHEKYPPGTNNWNLSRLKSISPLLTLKSFASNLATNLRGCELEAHGNDRDCAK